MCVNERTYLIYDNRRETQNKLDITKKVWDKKRYEILRAISVDRILSAEL
jgi:hypothetical protein